MPNCSNASRSPGRAPSCRGTQTDPVLLTRGLLDLSLKRGARLLKANAVAYDGAVSTVTVDLEDGFLIEARHVVLATGYVMPDIVRPTAQQPASSWAIATAPQADNL